MNLTERLQIHSHQVSVNASELRGMDSIQRYLTTELPGIIRLFAAIAKVLFDLLQLV